jgi:hypothetical protein
VWTLELLDRRSICMRWGVGLAMSIGIVVVENARWQYAERETGCGARRRGTACGRVVTREQVGLCMRAKGFVCRIHSIQP